MDQAPASAVWFRRPRKASSGPGDRPAGGISLAVTAASCSRGAVPGALAGGIRGGGGNERVRVWGYGNDAGDRDRDRDCRGRGDGAVIVLAQSGQGWCFHLPGSFLLHHPGRGSNLCYSPGVVASKRP